MQRDDEYLRDLLFEIDKQNECSITIVQTLDDSDNDKKNGVTFSFLCDADNLVQINKSAYRLISLGHDFNESICDEGIWNKTKDAFAETGGNATLEIIKKPLAYGLLKKKISTHTGIEV